MYQYTAEEWFDSGEGTVTLLGSTKFFFECMEISRQLTFKKMDCFILWKLGA